ncbi:MAG: acyl carrier protein [Bacteroidales bacterium]|nr:acyl carrier protein [Bacteroidales bacterium]
MESFDLIKFIKNFADQFDDTDAAEIKEDTNFKELDEWSSLIVLSIIALVKTQYGKTISGKEIRSCETVKDLFNLIESK